MQEIFEISENIKIAPDIFKMMLKGNTEAFTAPGQFINIKLDGCFLRRPISVCDWNNEGLTIIYKIVGRGTEILSLKKNGEKLDVLAALGNGFNTEKGGENPLIIGGGVGIPPLYGLAKRLIEEGKKPQIILGFNRKEEIFLYDEFCALTPDVTVTTADGTFGIKGFVTEGMKNKSYSYFYTCGPMPMFKAIEAAAVGEGQYSFEERMGCGFGACMGCSCKTKYGNKRICKDGPVLERSEIIW